LGSLYNQNINYTLLISDLGDEMVRKLFTTIILVAGLIGCSFPWALGGGIPPTPTSEVQITSPVAEATVEGTPAPVEIVPIPVSSIQIEGVPYSAYQIPGDPFRFVCQEPCSLDLQYIYAAYAGFRLGHARLIELTGVDTLAELQPVDMHLVLEDSICSELPVGHAYIYSQAHQAYACTDGPGYYPTIEEKIQMAARLDGQYFPLHEYMHTIFFGRISGKAGNFEDYKAEYLHDYVVPIPSYAIGELDTANFCSYRNVLPPGDFGGWLISELCLQNGFQLTTLALSLTELDNLYQSGGGQVNQEGFEHPVPTVAQYRDILNHLLGSDTTKAFVDACWPTGLFGNGLVSPPACVVPSTPGASGTPTPVN
jgi:hypothetical protein